ncbi:amidohydrolase [Evansella sp. AB-P1]|uniref:amidohydrolase n=1 Tax=Evansella sp. AB-P1 TaxID=3037653 RepID=UPI00241E136F|nr:amidohydrolase [Evansella sp. AB-P1]MDG5787009.1 amidohydrolase [Evansella sp. AB-P1]
MGTLWFGGKIRTLQHKKDIKEAVFVQDGIIKGVGEKSDLENQFKNSILEYKDLNDAVMYPGFVDSHLHMLGHGEKLLRLDLSHVESIDQLKAVLKKASTNLSQNDWLIGEGFNENLYPDQRIPDRLLLDEVTTEHPIVLTRVCRHALVTNSFGLQLANVDAETLNPSGGVIVKDSFGVPTGYLLDQAQELVKGILPKHDYSYLMRALKTSLHDLWRHGFVGGHTEDLNYYGDPVSTLQTFYDVIDGEKVKFRADLLIHHEVAPEIIVENNKCKNNPFINLNSIKIFADGALGGRTALLKEPYWDDPSTNGVAIHSYETLLKIVENARKLNMPVAIHVIGDLALEYALDALEKFPVQSGKRDRLIHLQVTSVELIKRLKRLPVVLDIQPRFVASDFPWVEERLGKERTKHSFAWKTLTDAGLICAGGSDAPIEPIDPMLGLHAAVTRRKPKENHEGYNPSEKLSLFQALRLFTEGSAMAICKERERGLIKEGYCADFTILDKDLFELSPDEWLNVNVVMTVVDNTVMFKRNSK